MGTLTDIERGELLLPEARHLTALELLAMAGRLFREDAQHATLFEHLDAHLHAGGGDVAAKDGDQAVEINKSGHERFMRDVDGAHELDLLGRVDGHHDYFQCGGVVTDQNNWPFLGKIFLSSDFF